MSFQHHHATARGEACRQPESHLRKICIKHWSNNVRGNIETLIVRVNQIDQD